MTSPEVEIDQGRRANETLVRKITELISAGRYDDLNDLMHDDLEFELPYAPEGIGPIFDKPTFAVMQKSTFELFSSFTLEPVEFHHLLDPDGLIAEYRSVATVKANGRSYRNRYIGVFKFRDGKVVAWREFHNPEIATAALRS